MADDVNIRVVTEDDSTAVWQELYKMFGDTQEQLDKLAVSAESLGFQQAAGQAQTLGNEVENTGKKAQETSSLFGQLGQAIMQGLGLGAGLSVFAGITSGIQNLIGELKSTVTEAAAAEEAQAKLNAILSATGGVSGVTAGQVNAFAQELQGLTGFEDDAIVSASTVMLTFRHISTTTFPQAMKASADLAAMWGMDLTSAARMVGRALDAPGEGLGMLTRLGVRFTDQQKELLQQLTSTGRGAEAQAMILDILSSKFGGTAQAMAETYTGHLERMRIKFGNLKEEIGAHVIPMLDMFVERLSRGMDSGGGFIGFVTRQLDEFTEQTEGALKQLDLFGMQLSAIGDFARSVASVFVNYWRNAIGIVGDYFERLKAQAAGAWASLTGNASEAAKQQAIVSDLTLQITERSAALGATLSSIAPVMQSAWANMTAELHRLNLEMDVATSKRVREGPTTSLPNSFAQQFAYLTGERFKNAATTGGTAAGDIWSDSFKDAVKKSDIPGFLESDIKSAQDKLKKLVPEMFPDLTAPGANGPFENIFRAADVAKRGADSPWAKVLGLTQDEAKSIVQKFGAGIIDESVKGLIDIKALQENAKLKQMAETMTRKFADELGGAMTSSSELQAAGTNAVSTLKAGIDRVSPGLVDGLKTTITTPIVQAFDAATTAVNTLIAALERLKAMGAKPPTGTGAGGGASEGTSGRMFGGIPAYARARGYS